MRNRVGIDGIKAVQIAALRSDSSERGRQRGGVRLGAVDCVTVGGNKKMCGAGRSHLCRRITEVMRVEAKRSRKRAAVLGVDRVAELRRRLGHPNRLRVGVPTDDFDRQEAVADLLYEAAAPVLERQPTSARKPPPSTERVVARTKHLRPINVETIERLASLVQIPEVVR